MIQTGTKIPKDPRNPKQRRGRRAPRGSPARPANLLYADVGANFPWRLMRKEKPLRFLSLVLFPGVSSVLSVSLTPKHRRIFPPPPTKQGNDSFYQLKATLPVCCRCLLGVHPLKCEIQAVLTGHWGPLGLSCILMECNHWGEKTFLMRTLSIVNVKFFLRGNPMAAGNVQLPQTSLPINSF